jgi:hypothetical protein
MAKDTLSFVDVRCIAYNKNPNNNMTTIPARTLAPGQAVLAQRLSNQRHPAVVEAIDNHFQCLVAHKTTGKRWVTKEQYIR